MNDDRHVDRYVRLTNRERFLIEHALSLLENACHTLGVAYDKYGRALPHTKEVIALSCVFCEENWIKEYYIRHANKVVSVQTMWKGDDDDVKRIGTREEYQEGGEE